MYTLTFYQILGDRQLAKIGRFTRERSYSVNYHDWPSGAFYVVSHPEFDTHLQTLGGFSAERIGSGLDYIVTDEKTDQRHFISIDGRFKEAYAIIPDEETMDIARNLVSDVFDNMSLDEIGKVLMRRGTLGLMEHLEARMVEALDLQLDEE